MTKNRDEVDIYVAEDLRDPEENEPVYSGQVPQSSMENEGRLILRPLISEDREIMSAFEQSDEFEKYWDERPFRGVYILGNDTDNIVDGETPYLHNVPSLQKYYLRSDGVKHIDLDELLEKHKTKAEKTMRPRLIFKVLRGPRITVYKDGSGRFASTGDLVNAPVDTSGSHHTLSSLFLILNSSLAAYYVNKIVYSESTETARILDAPYIRNIPIPSATEREGRILDRLADRLLFCHQYLEDGGFEDAEKSEVFNRVSDAMVSDLYLDMDQADVLWEEFEILDESLPYEEWANERFSKEGRHGSSSEDFWGIFNKEFDRLDLGRIRSVLNDIESDDRFERAQEIIYPYGNK